MTLPKTRQKPTGKPIRSHWSISVKTAKKNSSQNDIKFTQIWISTMEGFIRSGKLVKGHKGHETRYGKKLNFHNFFIYYDYLNLMIHVGHPWLKSKSQRSPIFRMGGRVITSLLTQMLLNANARRNIFFGHTRICIQVTTPCSGAISFKLGTCHFKPLNCLIMLRGRHSLFNCFVDHHLCNT